MQESTHIVALRLPKKTYAIVMKRSKDWEMSVSSLIREVVVKVFSEDNDQQTIKTYKPRKRR